MSAPIDRPLTGTDRNGNVWSRWFEGLYKAEARKFKLVDGLTSDDAQQVLSARTIDAVYGPVTWAAVVPTAKLEAEHRAVYLPREDYPGQMQQVGCRCGYRPKTPNRRGSTMFAGYRAHASKLGLKDDDREAVYASGEFAGLTWEQRAAREKTR